MPEPEFPTHNLSGFEVKHNRQVMPATLEPQIRKILHPTARVCHGGVAHAVLWTALIPEASKAFQGIGGSQYLSRRTAAVAFLLGWTSNGDTSKRADAPRFVLAPAQMQAETSHAVQRVPFVGSEQLSSRLFVALARTTAGA